MVVEDNRVASWLSHNKKYAETYTAAPNWSEFSKMINPAGAAVIVSCFDARNKPAEYFGITNGAAIMANAGGRVDSGTLRSIEVLDQLLAAKGGVTTILVAHHTDCGLTHITDAEIKAKLKERAPAKASDIDEMKFGEITDLKQAVIDDMEILKASPYLNKDTKVLGFLFDIFDGTVEEIKK